jgi:hypothetical protein
MHKVLLVLLSCATALAQEAPTTRPGGAAAGVEPPASTDAPALNDLAARMVAAYAELDSLYIESQAYESVHLTSDLSSTPELKYDDQAPLIMTVKAWMHPAHELRAEAYVNDKQVWGMVSQPMKDGKSMVVQWNEKQITRPFPAGDLDEGRSANLKDNVPGHCTLGWYLHSLVGGKEARPLTSPRWLWKDRIRGGKYEGRVKDVLGNECYCVSCTVGDDVLFKLYLDTKTFLITQIDKIQFVMTPDEKIVGVGSQRSTFRNVPQPIDPEKFSFPAPDRREVVEATAQ